MCCYLYANTFSLDQYKVGMCICTSCTNNKDATKEVSLLTEWIYHCSVLDKMSRRTLRKTEHLLVLGELSEDCHSVSDTAMRAYIFFPKRFR